MEEKEENVEEKAKKGAEEEREVDWREKQIEDSFRFRGKKRNFMVSAITGHVSSGTLGTGTTPQLVTDAEDAGAQHCVPRCTPVYPGVPLGTPVSPWVPLGTPGYPPLCTPVCPCVPLCTPVYPCVPLCTLRSPNPKGG